MLSIFIRDVGYVEAFEVDIYEGAIITANNLPEFGRIETIRPD